jgi:hypothetical protein
MLRAGGLSERAQDPLRLLQHQGNHYYQRDSGGGSGGSILLRGEAGVTILPGAQVTARGGSAWGGDPVTFGAPGYVRIDAWGGLPVIQGAIVPAPTVIELPYLREAVAPQVGSLGVLQVFTPVSTHVLISGSLQPGPGTVTPFGIVGIDVGSAASFGFTYIFGQPGVHHDPRAELNWPIPNAAGLIGLQVWFQGLAVGLGLPPRLTNTVAVVIR